MTDTTLAHNYAATHNPEAFAALVTHYQRMVFATCRRQLHDRTDLDDAVQETFLRLAQNAQSLHANVGGWLHRCAVNVATDMNRRRAARRRHEANATPPPIDQNDPQQELAELREHLDAALAKLEHDQRELVIQRYFVGRAQTELAAELQVAPSTITHRLDRAVDALRQHLQTLGAAALPAAILPALLDAESASSTVSPALTANLMKIGLTGAAANAAAITAVPLLLKLLAVAATLLLLIAGTYWGLHRPAPIAPTSLTAITAPGLTVGPTLPNQPSQPPKWKTTAAPATNAILAGRILDTAGNPVPNATVRLHGPHSDEAICDNDGNYEFDILETAGQYNVSVEAEGFVPVGVYASSSPSLQLTEQSQARRDFILQRGVPVSITITDAASKPVDVRVCDLTLPNDPRNTSTRLKSQSPGVQTCVLAVSTTPYVLTVMADGYAPGHAQILPASVDKPINLALTLTPGLTVKGIALCADGKPATGWSIIAEPEWWVSGYSALEFPIDADGNFTLKNIIPGTYNLSISIPQGNGSTSSRLATLTLPPATQPLHLDIPGPSPSTFTAVTGRLRFLGGTPNSIEVSANTTSGARHYYSAITEIGSTRTKNRRLKNDEAQFTFKSLPPGTYRISIASAETEPKIFDNVRLPADLPPIDINYIGKNHLAGTVVDAHDHHPIAHFAFRIRKIQSLGDGPNYGQSAEWTQADNPDGEFNAELVGPGIYQMQVSADGYAWLWSPKVRIEKPGETGTLSLQLSAGGSLVGTVLDPAGKPLANAKVIPLSMAKATDSDFTGEHFASDAGSVLTDVQGKFLLPHLAAGEETLKIASVHFAPLIVKNLHVTEDQTTPVGPLTVHVGGSVEGTVYDGQGHLAPNVTLRFQDSYAYTGSESSGRLAVATTDDHGHYHIDHLSDQILYVQRDYRSNQLGVSRRVFFPRDGLITRLDFGGPTPITGRLLCKGQPVSNHVVELAAGDGMNARYSGPIIVNASTDADGRFTFFGPPPGHYILYSYPTSEHDELLAVKPVDITESSADLGDCNLHLGSVHITLAADDPADLSKLQYVALNVNDHPDWPWQEDVARAAQLPDHPNEWVANNVPAGPLCIQLRDGGAMVITAFVRDANAQDTQVQCHLPAASATLTIPQADPATRSSRGAWLRSTDGRISVRAWPSTTQSTTLKIPAATYDVIDPFTGQRIAPDNSRSSIALAVGESHTLDLSPVLAVTTTNTVMEIHPWTHDGILLTTPTIQLLDAKERPIAAIRDSYLGPLFRLPPGAYHAVIAKSPNVPATPILVPPSDHSNIAMPVDIFLP